MNSALHAVQREERAHARMGQRRIGEQTRCVGEPEKLREMKETSRALRTREE